MNVICYVARWFGTWWDLYFTGIDPLSIHQAKVVSVDELRN